jgi:hypothetical protein
MSALAVCGVLAFATATAWGQPIVLIVERDPPTAVRAAITSLTWFFANVVQYVSFVQVKVLYEALRSMVLADRVCSISVTSSYWY